jgi:hypothetical protein
MERMGSPDESRRVELLLSIVIPTRNRPDYLETLVRALLASPRRDFEIIIQDNSDDDQLRHRLGAFCDSRLSYHYYEQRVSVVSNCDMAVDAARGHYVCMLGDDDGLLLEESLTFLTACRNSQIDGVVPSSYYYTWPDVISKAWGNIGGRLYHARFTGRVRSLDVGLELRRVISDGGALGLRDLPRVYHGFVSRSALLRLKAVAQTYFPGPSPDMANAVALSRVIGWCVRADYPYIVVGHSRGSGGGMGAEKKHKGELSRQHHLPADTVATWSSAIPFFWSGPTIYAQSAYRALHALWPDGGRPRMTYACLYASCLVYEPQYWRSTLEAVSAAREWRPGLLVRVTAHAIRILVQRIRSYVRNFTAHMREAKTIPTIALAFDEARSRASAAGLVVEMPGVRG